MCEDPNETIHQELIALYGACVSEIQEFKQQQWHVANYAFLLDAALVAISQLMIKPLPTAPFTVFSALALVIVIVTWFILGEFDESIRQRQARLIAVRREFSDVFMGAWRGGDDHLKDDLAEKKNLLWLFRGAAVVAFGMTIGILYVMHSVPSVLQATRP